MASRADDVQLIVADHARAFGDETPLARQRIELSGDRVPIQRQLAFAFAAFDGQRDSLNLADQFQRLDKLDVDAQIVFLLQVGDLRLVLALGGFDPQAFARGVAFLLFQLAPRFFAQAVEVLVNTLQIAIQSPLHPVDELPQMRADADRQSARDRLLQLFSSPIRGQLRRRRLRHGLRRAFVERCRQQLINHRINRAPVDQVESEPDDPLALLVRDCGVAENKNQIARPRLLDLRQAIDRVLQRDVVFDYALDVAERRDGCARGEFQSPPSPIQQFAEPFEPVRFEARALSARRQFRRETEPQKLRRAQRLL
ncbi:MAG: hypothetical protein JMDDDDMK_04751 [Acidobacteria bacterium]|nr:hypothetical protein [Acidobacteriota bacterium]